jgi:hypothetical protein
MFIKGASIGRVYRLGKGDEFGDEFAPESAGFPVPASDSARARAQSTCGGGERLRQCRI